MNSMNRGEQLNGSRPLRWRLPEATRWRTFVARVLSASGAGFVKLLAVSALAIGLARAQGDAVMGAAATASSPELVSALRMSALQLLVLSIALLLALAALFWIFWRQRSLTNALRQSRAQLASLNELLDVWQWQTDPEHRLTRLQPPRGQGNTAWSTVADGGLLWAQFQAADDAALRARLARAVPLDEIACRRLVAGGSRSMGHLSARALTDASGAFAGYIGTFREQASALAEAAPAAVEAQVQAAGPEVPAEIGSSESEHESFSYTVSHDLRAPIRVVEGFTKIVKEDYGRLLDRIGNDHLDRVLGAAARMNSMIDALLALSKLGSQPLARQPVNMTQLAGYVVDDLRRQWPERQVDVEIEPGLLVLGDPTLLRMLLENLLGNAWKYTGKSAEPRIGLQRHATEIDCFTVHDNGAGFDMRFAERLFGVFQRLHSASDFPGTGVGLASVRRIVRRHGGSIWGEAEVNHGARFHFSLPQRSPARRDASPPQGGAERRQR